MDKPKSKKGELVIYETPSGDVKLDVQLENDTVWLSLNQMAELFGTDKSGISRHLKNIFSSGELSYDATVAKFATVQKEGGRNVTRNIEFYNLDAIISVGYRVNSVRGTQFRIWAGKILQNYLLKGYVLNDKLIEVENKYKELNRAIELLNKKIKLPELGGQERELLEILNSYSNSLKLLGEYDDDKIEMAGSKKVEIKLTYGLASNLVKSIRRELAGRGEVSADLFGVESGKKLDAAVSNVYQTYGKRELYPTLEEKAANLLYLIIKDHPFLDGNKRIASILTIYFLKINDYLYNDSYQPKINDASLASLALLIAASDPKEKEILIKIITNLLAG
jgi:death-on-curing family protein